MDSQRLNNRLSRGLKIITLAVALHSGFSSSLMAAEKITISTLDDYVQRVSLAVMSEAYSRIGMGVEIKYMPPKRAVTSANSGKTQAELSRVGGLATRFPNLIQIPVAINAVEPSVFTLDEVFEVNGWDSLKPYEIGVRRGLVSLARDTSDMKTLPVKTISLLFDVLLGERVDIVVADRFGGQMVINQKGLASVRVLTPSVESHPLFHYVHKSHSHLVPQLTKALEKMRSEGAIKKIQMHTKAELLAAAKTL